MHSFVVRVTLCVVSSLEAVACESKLGLAVVKVLSDESHHVV